MELYCVMTILDRNKRDRLAKIQRSLGLNVELSMLGRGTAPKELLTMRGLQPTEKVIVTTSADGEDLKKLIRRVKQELYIDIPGNGILLAVPIKSAGGAQALAYLAGEKKANQEKPAMNFEYELIYVILNEGYSDDVMDAARSAGAAGGTVLSAKGTAIKQAEKFQELTLANEKEVILIVARSSVKAAIMRAIIEKAGLETKAGAICFSLPVSRIEGLRRLDEENDEPEKTEADHTEEGGNQNDHQV